MAQTEYFGYGSVINLRRILDMTDSKNIFLVTGKSSYDRCGAGGTLDNLLDPFSVFRFSDFTSNPKKEDRDFGVDLFCKSGYDIIVAVGGGSVIDMGKLIKHSVGKPLVAVPTTGGTGSEATHFAVLYSGGRKHSINTGTPDFSILDPQFLFGSNAYLRACSGFDALSQAIESYWSVCSTDESQRFSKEAIELGLKNLFGFVLNPSRRCKEDMLKAANLSGKAIDISKTTAPHAVSYPFTSHFGIPHGHAVALTLSDFYKYNSEVLPGDVVDPRGADYVLNSFSELNRLLGVSDSSAARDRLIELISEIGLETDLSLLGMQRRDIETILRNVNPERLSNNPRRVSKAFLREVISSKF